MAFFYEFYWYKDGIEGLFLSLDQNKCRFCVFGFWICKVIKYGMEEKS